MYAAVALWWIYVGAERQFGFGQDAAFVFFFGAVLLLHFATGFAVGRWWAVTLPVLGVLAAVPAGYPDDNRGEPFVIWVGLALFAAPLGIGSTAFGVAVRRLRNRRLTRQSRDGS